MAGVLVLSRLVLEGRDRHRPAVEILTNTFPLTVCGGWVASTLGDGKTMEGKTMEGKTMEGETMEGKTMEGETMQECLAL